MYVFTDGQIRFSQKFVESYNVIQVTTATYPAEYAAGLYTYKGNLQVPADADKITFKYVNDDNVEYELDTVYVVRDGFDGSRGSLWYNGTELTGTGTVHGTAFMTDIYVIGDIYVNSNTYEFYKCITAGTGTASEWLYLGIIKGTPGAPLNNAGNWTVGLEYKADSTRTDIVFNTEDGALYTCLQNHTANNTNKPGNTSYWSKFAQISQTLYFFRTSVDKIYRYDDGTVSDGTITVTPYTQLEGSNPITGVPSDATFSYIVTHKNGTVGAAVNLSKTQATVLTVAADWVKVVITLNAGTETQTWTVSIDDYSAHYLGAVTTLPAVHGKGDWFTWSGPTSGTLTNGYVYMYGTGNNYSLLDPNAKIPDTNLLANSKQYMQALDDILRSQKAGPGYFSTIFCNAFFANSASIDALQTKTIVLQGTGGSITTEGYITNTSGFALLNKDHPNAGGTPYFDFNGNFHLGGTGSIGGNVNISGNLNGATGSFTGEFSTADNKIKFKQSVFNNIFVSIPQSSPVLCQDYIYNILHQLGKGFVGKSFNRAGHYYGMEQELIIDKNYFGVENLIIKYGNNYYDKLILFYYEESDGLSATHATYKIIFEVNGIQSVLINITNTEYNFYVNNSGLQIYIQKSNYTQQFVDDITGNPSVNGYLYTQSGFLCRQEESSDKLIFYGKTKSLIAHKTINLMDRLFYLEYKTTDRLYEVFEDISINCNFYEDKVIPCIGCYDDNVINKIRYEYYEIFLEKDSTLILRLNFDNADFLAKELKLLLII